MRLDFGWMVVFSPVIWLRMVYSPGEDAERTRTRVLARSRSGAASIQRRPLLSTLKISNGGIMAGLKWYQNTPPPICLSRGAKQNCFHCEAMVAQCESWARGNLF